MAYSLTWTDAQCDPTRRFDMKFKSDFMSIVIDSPPEIG